MPLSQFWRSALIYSNLRSIGTERLDLDLDSSGAKMPWLVANAARRITSCQSVRNCAICNGPMCEDEILYKERGYVGVSLLRLAIFDWWGICRGVPGSVKCNDISAAVLLYGWAERKYFGLVRSGLSIPACGALLSVTSTLEYHSVFWWKMRWRWLQSKESDRLYRSVNKKEERLRRPVRTALAIDAYDLNRVLRLKTSSPSQLVIFEFNIDIKSRIGLYKLHDYTQHVHQLTQDDHTERCRAHGVSRFIEAAPRRGKAERMRTMKAPYWSCNTYPDRIRWNASSRREILKMSF